jgi:hypothetical protein
MRRLERSLWKNYLGELGKISPENYIIYQWREGGSPSDNVKNFIALAFFQTPRYHVRQYILGILTLGAMGGSIQSFLTFLLRDRKFPSPEDSLGTQVVVTLLLMLAFALVWLASADLRGALSRVRSRAKGIPFLRRR